MPRWNTNNPVNRRENRYMKRLMMLAFMGLAMVGLSACQDNATTANNNLTTAADNFEVNRNIVFYNTWTDTEVVSVTGFCSIEDKQHKLWVTCKDADGVKRHQLGRSANLTYFMTQIESVDVSLYHTRIVWKPQAFIPDIDLRIDTEELTKDRY